MKRQLRFIAVLITIGLTTKAQLPASTSPQTKKVLFEEYTGVNCGNCPNGHKIASQVEATNPNNVIIVNVHESYSFSNPSMNEADFETPDGVILGATFSMQTFPSALVNRSQYNSSFIVYANNFAATASAQTVQNAYCNVACQGTLDVQTRQLSVQAQVYYTGNSPVATNYLTVMLVEDDIMHFQRDWGPGFGFNPTNWYTTYANHRFYKHHGVLRKVLTAPLGNSITPTTAGTTINSAIFNYTVPQMYGTGTNTNTCYLGNLRLVAFVTQNNYIVANAANGPISLTNHTNARDIAPILVSDNAACTGNYNAFLQFTNYGSTPVTNAAFQYTANNGSPMTYTYTGNVPSYALSFPVAIPNLSFTPMSTNTVGIKVTSVNSNTDLNSSNDIFTKTVADAPLATVNQFTMNFYQDQFGSNTYWTIVDEATGTPVETDGPWTNLATAGTQLNQKVFTLPNTNTCYKLKVFDSQGDGVNGYYGSYGAGHYDLKWGANNTIVNFNGYFTYENYHWFKTSFPLTVAHHAQNINAASVFPNPADHAATLKLNINEHENVAVQITNALGQIVYANTYNLDAGLNSLELDCEKWQAGFYNIACSTPRGTVNLKLIVTK